MTESIITQLTDMIHATLVDDIEPWPLPALETVQESLWQLRACPEVRDLLEAFRSQCGIGDAVYTLMDYDLISSAEVDRLSWRDGRDPYVAFKPLIRRAYMDSVARGLVPGRLN